MRPFWAELRKLEEEEEEGISVLPSDPSAYVDDDPLPLPRKSDRPLFPAGAPTPSSGSRTKKKPDALPAATVKPNVRTERHFSNRHILDKRAGAQTRAEALRATILRGSQASTVMKGSDAFRSRGNEGYVDIDELQPEGPRVVQSGRPASESSDSESSEFDAGRLPRPPTLKDRRKALSRGERPKGVTGFVRASDQQDDLARQRGRDEETKAEVRRTAEERSKDKGKGKDSDDDDDDDGENEGWGAGPSDRGKAAAPSTGAFWRARRPVTATTRRRAPPTTRSNRSRSSSPEPRQKSEIDPPRGQKRRLNIEAGSSTKVASTSDEVVVDYF
eukprot:CAMPEP_0206568802 /NCGR_PEP_ID=MMETSP0325_2-20121206/26049_1 /ASSEMBLY_ACC=CAM_ASM_000347 /TAXON_ID=2866 /ORGANISM="Crypthecodinium cohnii, Strain Seligo" /LENGTH=330 /DNA_ID=CAMNT_0054072249 /DNA_START=28 /DNA_END=1020 /DNA_ORIENTATION=-